MRSESSPIPGVGEPGNPRIKPKAPPFLYAVVLLAAVLVPAASASTACASAAAESRAAYVIKFADGQEETRCSSFGEAGTPESMDGVAALRGTGLAVVTKDFGGDLGHAVCKIGDVGSDTCDNTGFWWNYKQSATGGWDNVDEGASNHQVVDGSVEAWVWVASGSEQTPPASRPDFAAICRGPLASPAGDDQAASAENRSWLPWAAGLGVLLIIAVGIGIARRGST